MALKIWGRYVTQDKQQDKYSVLLVDNGCVVDVLDYPAKGTTVQTPSGYTKDPEGARKHAEDHWL